VTRGKGLLPVSTAIGGLLVGSNPLLCSRRRRTKSDVRAQGVELVRKEAGTFIIDGFLNLMSCFSNLLAPAGVGLGCQIPFRSQRPIPTEDAGANAPAKHRRDAPNNGINTTIIGTKTTTMRLVKLASQNGRWR